MDNDSRKIDIDKLISYSDGIVHLLKDQKDINYLKHSFEHTEELRARCHSDNHQLHTSLQDIEKKIDLCKNKTEAVKAEVASDADLRLLQKELDDEFERETLLKEELRATTNHIKDLDEQRNLIEKRRRVLKKLEQDEIKAEMKLSMYASVTSIIPDLNDQSKKSGLFLPSRRDIVDKEKKVVQKLELSSQEMSDFETCNAIWNMITHPNVKD